MKKLMIAAFVAVLGIAANAASVQWQANAIQGPNKTTAAVGWLVQVYTSDVDYDYAKAAAGTITAWDSAATVALNTTFRVQKTKADGQDAGTTKSYYAVIYDAGTVAGAKNYIVSDTVDVTIGAGGSSGALSFGAMMATTADKNKFLNSSWQSVPEPTSGLLLLLGVAGLALKRKRA